MRAQNKMNKIVQSVAAVILASVASTSFAAVVLLPLHGRYHVDGQALHIAYDVGVMNHHPKMVFAVPKGATHVNTIVLSQHHQKVVVFNNGYASIVGTHDYFKIPKGVHLKSAIKKAPKLNIQFNITPAVDYVQGGYATGGSQNSSYKLGSLTKESGSSYMGYQCDPNAANNYSPYCYSDSSSNLSGTIEPDFEDTQAYPLSYWHNDNVQFLQSTTSGSFDGSLSVPKSLQSATIYGSGSQQVQAKNLPMILTSGFTSLKQHVISSGACAGGHCDSLQFEVPQGSYQLPIFSAPISTRTKLSQQGVVSLDHSSVVSPYYSTYDYLALTESGQKWQNTCAGGYSVCQYYAHNKATCGYNGTTPPSAASTAAAQAKMDAAMDAACYGQTQTNEDNGQVYQGLRTVTVEITARDKYGNEIGPLKAQFAVALLPTQVSMVSMPLTGENN